MKLRKLAQDEKLLLSLSFTQLVAWGSCYYAYAVLMAPVQAALGISRSTAAGAYSLGLLVMGFAAIPVGLMIDRGHHRAVLLGGTLVTMTGMLLHAAIEQVWQLYAVWALIGAGMAATLYESVFAFLIRAYPDDYRKRITFVTLLGGLASTVFWPLTTLLLSQFGWRGAFVGLAVLQLLGCLLLHARYLPGSLANATAHDSPHAVARPPAGPLLRSRPFVLLALSFTLQSIVLAGMAAHILALLAAAGVPAAIALAAASSIGIMQVAGRALLLMAGSRLPPASVANIVIWLLPVAVIVLLAMSVNPWLAFLYAFLFGAGNGMMTIVKGTATADLISKNRVATLNGVMATPMAVARAAGPVLIASCWDFFGSPRAAVLVILGMSALAAVALMGAYRSAQGGASGPANPDIKP
ncbi:MAG: MFS transporter [Betaproteobacteria bacterium]|nr:MFS transporter [Betaproteobacteria bacterium]